jgi:histidyl-tRNA synthetase
MIDLVVGLLETLGVLDVEVLVNSLGDHAARERYRQALVVHLTPFADKLSEESRRRLATNPLRILDSKSPGDQELCASAPTIVDFLGEADRAHFEALKKALDALGTKYRVEPKLVRGLDYYSRTLFEIQGRGGELGAQNALCGGGRYDGLVKEIGGPDVPSIGFAMGLERILLALPPEAATASVDVAVIAAGEPQREAACVLLRDLRREGVSADADLRGPSVKSQLRRADKLGAKVVLFLGDEETARGVVSLKNMRARTQNDVARADVVAEAVRVAREPA